jgi:hypothetical protein
MEAHGHQLTGGIQTSGETLPPRSIEILSRWHQRLAASPNPIRLGQAINHHTVLNIAAGTQLAREIESRPAPHQHLAPPDAAWRSSHRIADRASAIELEVKHWLPASPATG